MGAPADKKDREHSVNISPECKTTNARKKWYNKNNMRHLVLVSLLFAVIAQNIAVNSVPVYAAATSANFLLPSDGFNNGGGTASAPSYKLQDVIGESALGDPATSGSYVMQENFIGMENPPVFRFTISGGAALTLSPNPVVGTTATATTTLETSTSAPFGYVTTIAEDGDFRDGGTSIPDVTDGAVDGAPTAEYGIEVTGGDRAFSDDEAITGTPKIIAANTGVSRNRSISVIYKLRIANDTVNGTYGHVVTYVSSPTF